MAKNTLKKTLIKKKLNNTNNCLFKYICPITGLNSFFIAERKRVYSLYGKEINLPNNVGTIRISPADVILISNKRKVLKLFLKNKKLLGKNPLFFH